MAAKEITARERLVKEIQLRLGVGIIDIEADPEHYEMAITMALDRYRQRSDNSMEESFVFLDIKKDIDVYYLPKEVQLVKELYRRGIGSSAGGVQIDPFNIAYTNNLYMLANPGSVQPNGSGGSLATFDFAMQYQELAGRMFGRDVLWSYEPTTHRLLLHRKFMAEETVLLWVFNQKPDELIITDVYSKPWIRDAAVAYIKIIIGEARSKFAQMAGPQGGFSLNGNEMKEEGLAELDRLDREVFLQIEGGKEGYGFVIG